MRQKFFLLGFSMFFFLAKGQDTQDRFGFDFGGGASVSKTSGGYYKGGATLYFFEEKVHLNLFFRNGSYAVDDQINFFGTTELGPKPYDRILALAPGVALGESRWLVVNIGPTHIWGRRLGDEIYLETMGFFSEKRLYQSFKYSAIGLFTGAQFQYIGQNGIGGAFELGYHYTPVRSIFDVGLKLMVQL